MRPSDQAAAELTGLKPGTPVAGGLFDIDACALSSALLDEHQFGMTFGTWGINQYVSPTPVVDNIFMTSRYCVPGYYLMLEGSATSAANLEWFLAQFFRGETAVGEGSRPRSVCAGRCLGCSDGHGRNRFALLCRFCTDRAWGPTPRAA